ncbi:DUF6509 family protein [Paenibacillus pini]|uniref:Pullulanase n=1 Tax=Paenibacillus pini JCM 16418 TaxID=1236976 RepID=W7YF61_9BACL|nr:DUF6509 family protein [Paenibacillus pini]GAF06133.1 hypothetical protein JCM16418_78 [Paenibacillus pini JCM 16418]
MLIINEYQVEAVKDPFHILTGDRYEFTLQIEVAEDDEIFTENGLYVRVIYRVEDDNFGIVKYEVYEKGTDKYQDLELEDDEIAMIDLFCKEHLSDE